MSRGLRRALCVAAALAAAAAPAACGADDPAPKPSRTLEWRSFAHDRQSGTVHLVYETGMVGSGEGRGLAKPVVAIVSVQDGITYIRLRDDGRPVGEGSVRAKREQGCATVVLPKGVPLVRVRDESRPGASPRVYDSQQRERLLSACRKVQRVELNR